jgi:hypothetical protein
MRRQPAKTKTSLPKITEFHINGAVPVNPLSRAIAAAKRQAQRDPLMPVPHNPVDHQWH